MFPEIDRVYVNERAQKELGCPCYDFHCMLNCLQHGVDFRSSLARAVGSKGYHTHCSPMAPIPLRNARFRVDSVVGGATRLRECIRSPA
jgi:UDP-glucose 4-epimerase